MKNQYLNLLKRLYSTHTNVETKVCIIGSGPAGFYAAQHLVKHVPSIKIDVYDKLPVPFGLVRFGVAPDHPEVKNVINTFTKTAENKNVAFLGNVCLGRDIYLRELKAAYHVVLLTYGAEQHRRLNIFGENLKNVISARNIVGWYNGLPQNRDLNIDLSKPTVAIIGQGNVAVDVARILLSPVDLLKKTDITQYALEALSNSKIKEVCLIGRRGPLQAAFTIKELREMLKLPDCSTVWNHADFSDIKEVLPQLSRPKKRITELMLKSVNENTTGNKKFRPIFFRTPLEFIGAQSVEKLKFCVNKLDGPDCLTKQSVPTNEIGHLDCGLAVVSIGYKSIQADPDIPFDTEKGIAKNKNGKICDELYATGWLASGPTGVILTTMSNSFFIAENIVTDLKQRQLTNKPGFHSIQELLCNRGVQIVHWKDWLKIDAYEKEEGKKVGKPREKISSVEKMLEIAA